MAQSFGRLYRAVSSSSLALVLGSLVCGCRPAPAAQAEMAAAGSAEPRSSAGTASGASLEAPSQAQPGSAVPAAETLPKAAPAPRASAKVLFSGHSLLDNPLPDWVELIADSRGDKLEWEEQIVLGSPIRVRTRGDDSNGKTWAGYALGKNREGWGKNLLLELEHPAALASGGKYDTLLITESANLLPSIQWENTVGYLRSYHERVEAQNPAARTLLYELWTRIDKSQPERWLRFVRQELFAWECVASKVNLDLAASGRKGRVSIVPGGLALAALVEQALKGGVPGVSGSTRQRLEVIFSDDAHLNPTGVYVIAALQYAALFGKSPIGAAAPPELPQGSAPVLQRIAWEVFARYHARPTPWEHSMQECRQRMATVLCPAFYEFYLEPQKAAGCGDWAAADGPFSSQPSAPLPP